MILAGLDRRRNQLKFKSPLGHIVYKKIDVKAGRAGTQIGDKDDGRD